jgi:hypothetical protein
LIGIKPVEALESFYLTMHIDADFIETHFNAALALYQRGQREEASQHIRGAGELAYRNESMVNSVLYRAHWRLFSALERRPSGEVSVSVLMAGLRWESLRKLPSFQIAARATSSKGEQVFV